MGLPLLSEWGLPLFHMGLWAYPCSLADRGADGPAERGFPLTCCVLGFPFRVGISPSFSDQGLTLIGNNLPFPNGAFPCSPADRGFPLRSVTQGIPPYRDQGFPLYRAFPSTGHSPAPSLDSVSHTRDFPVLHPCNGIRVFPSPSDQGLPLIRYSTPGISPH
jgi:hypothetical protein